MGVVIRILDNSNNVLGDLDLANFKDFPLALTKGIVNLDNLKVRTGTFSKTFKVPNTKNNSKLLSNVDNINSKKDYRDALNRKPCVIIVDNNQNDTGFLQVSKAINKDYFELIFFGNNIDWVKSSSELKLNAIAWNNNTQIYNEAGITTANAATSDTYDHAYPYISRGENNINNTEVEDFYPCFYLRSILERGLNQLGWNVSSNFLITAEIKKLICDLNPLFTLKDDEVENSILRAEKTTPSTTNISAGVTSRIIFDDDTNLPNKDAGLHYNHLTGIYTATRSGKYKISVYIDTFKRTLFSDTGTLSIVSNGDSTTSIGNGNVLGFNTVFIPAQAPNNFGSKTFSFSVSINIGDELSIYFSANSANSQNISYDSGTFVEIQISNKIEKGDSFELNNIIPDNITLIDVINDFTRMFNIYYWTDSKTKTIYFEPRNSFFKPITQALDWTDKIDFSKNYEIDYINTYKRNVEFKYKNLNNDEWLKGWQDVNKRIYARYNYVLPDRFAEGTDTIELGLFSACYSEVANEATPIINGSFNSNIVFTTIREWNEYINTGTPPAVRITDYNPKIFFFNNGSQVSTNGISRIINLFGNNSTIIPYGIFETFNNVTSPMNLSFTGADGLFATHYANMFKNIEDGGRLTAYIKLDDVDINNLDFRKLVYISTPSEITGYYIVEKVQDYKPLSDGTTKVNLFKFEDLGNVAIDATQKGNNGNSNNGNNPVSPNPVYVVSNGQIIEVCVFDQITQNFEPVIL